MRAKRIEAWKIGNLIFETRDKALSHLENAVHAEMKHLLLARGFSESEAFKVTETLLDNRATLAALLSFEIDEESES